MQSITPKPSPQSRPWNKEEKKDDTEYRDTKRRTRRKKEEEIEKNERIKMIKAKKEDTHREEK